MNPLAGSLLAIALFLAPASSAASPPAGLFRPDDTVVFVGGSTLVAEQFEGYIETLLTAARPDLGLGFRSMAWEADTVYRQQRPLNFPGWEEQLAKVEADVLVMHFGQMESLDGETRLHEFEAAYRDLLELLGDRARSVLLVSPHPFEDFEFFPEGEVRRRNRSARAYSDAIKRIADEEKNRHFVDILLPLMKRGSKDSPRLTSNGVQLTSRGHRAVADAFAAALGYSRAFSSDLEPLRRIVVEKNILWHEYWRPTNWAFLHGDRTHVQSSRDHRDMEIRWFPAEMEQYRPLIRDAESRIRAAAESIRRFPSP